MTLLSELQAAVEHRREATPGPWIRKWASLDVHHMFGDDALRSQRDIDAAVAACNLLDNHGPALLALVAAAEAASHPEEVVR